MIKGLREHAKMKRRFDEKLNYANEQYQQYLEHLQTVFKIELEKALNEEVDKQTREFSFDGTKINKIVQAF